MFEAGMLVRCINNQGQEVYLTEGQVYTVEDTEFLMGADYIKVWRDPGGSGWFYADRFEKVEV